MTGASPDQVPRRSREEDQQAYNRAQEAIANVNRVELVPLRQMTEKAMHGRVRGMERVNFGFTPNAQNVAMLAPPPPAPMGPGAGPRRGPAPYSAIVEGPHGPLVERYQNGQSSYERVDSEARMQNFLGQILSRALQSLDQAEQARQQVLRLSPGRDRQRALQLIVAAERFIRAVNAADLLGSSGDHAHADRLVNQAFIELMNNFPSDVQRRTVERFQRERPAGYLRRDGTTVQFAYRDGRAQLDIVSDAQTQSAGSAKQEVQRTKEVQAKIREHTEQLKANTDLIGKRSSELQKILDEDSRAAGEMGPLQKSQKEIAARMAESEEQLKKLASASLPPGELPKRLAAVRVQMEQDAEALKQVVAQMQRIEEGQGRRRKLIQEFTAANEKLSEINRRLQADIKALQP